MTVPALTALLLGARYRSRVTEGAVQDDIASCLTSAGTTFEREVELGPTDRIDFMIGTVGLEVKVQGSANQVLRQLQRYAQSPRVTELVLFTMRAQLGHAMPETLSEKPLTIVRYWAGI